MSYEVQTANREGGGFPWVASREPKDLPSLLTFNWAVNNLIIYIIYYLLFILILFNNECHAGTGLRMHTCTGMLISQQPCSKVVLG
jgi:hypothetical protein